MSDAFVPFAPEPAHARKSDAGFKVVVLPQATPAAAPFIPAQAVVPHVHAGREPEVTLDRDGDRITRITVRCACGQVVELNCTY